MAQILAPFGLFFFFLPDKQIFFVWFDPQAVLDSRPDLR